MPRMLIHPITYADVKVGDEIRNPHSYEPGGSWLRVLETTTKGDYVTLRTFAYSQEGHAREGIAVRRPEPNPSGDVPFDLMDSIAADFGIDLPARRAAAIEREKAGLDPWGD